MLGKDELILSLGESDSAKFHLSVQEIQCPLFL